MRPDSVWSLEPRKETIPPEGVVEIVVTATFNDAIKFVPSVRFLIFRHHLLASTSFTLVLTSDVVKTTNVETETEPRPDNFYETKIDNKKSYKNIINFQLFRKH